MQHNLYLLSGLVQAAIARRKRSRARFIRWALGFVLVSSRCIAAYGATISAVLTTTLNILQ